MNNFKEFVDVDTPTPADKWLSLSEEERIKRVVGMMEKPGENLVYGILEII